MTQTTTPRKGSPPARRATAQITVPAVAPNTSAWRKTIAGLTAARGGAAVEGTWLQADDVVEVPAGTLVLAVDKVTTGWDYAYITGERIPVQEATVAVYLAAPDGLTQLWSRHYKSAKSAFGATTMKKLAGLLEQHPCPAGTVAVVTEARRPNKRPMPCRWCHAQLPAGCGHLVGHGDRLTAEHWQECPAQRVLTGVCELCGVTIAPSTAAGVVVVREEAGRRSTRHLPEVRCTESAPESAEGYADRIAEQRHAEAEARARQAEKERKAAGRKAQRGADRKAAAEAAERAELGRIADLTETGRSAVNLNDKGIGGGQRAALDEVTVGLSDGTTTIRWVVRTYGAGSGWTGEDYDPPDEGQEHEHTSKAAAQVAYRALKFEPARREPTSGGSVCDECGRGRGTFQRRDSSGIAGVVCVRCNSSEDYELSFA